MLPRKILDKNGAIWCNLGLPKYVITNLKINNFKEKRKPTKNEIAIFLSNINLDEDVSTKINTFQIYKGGLGANLPEAEDFFLKLSNKMEAFPYFILLFGKAP